jgi:Flavin containing amine oxidoreductase
MGLWNALDYVLSAGALAKIREVGTFYHLIPENPSASEWTIFWLRLFRTSRDLSTIEGTGGVSQIITRRVGTLREMGERNVDIATGAPVVHVGPADRYDQIRLKVDFQEPGRVLDLDFDHVILALPKQPLSKLTAHFTPEIRRYIEGVNGFPLLKAFAILEKPWWKQQASRCQRRSTVPISCRRAKCATRSTRQTKTSQWSCSIPTVPPMPIGRRTFTRPMSRQVNRPHELKRELAAQLLALKMERETGPQETYKDQIDDMEKAIAGFAIRDWSRPPFGAASHAWIPGINVPEAIDRLKAFSLVGRPGLGNLHVCGEAYSDYQGFIEGALRSATNAIMSIRD